MGMAQQVTIWITSPQPMNEDLEFALLTTLASKAREEYHNTSNIDLAFLVEEVGNDPDMFPDTDEHESFSTMCEYCTEDHRGYYNSVDSYKVHLIHDHPDEYQREYGTDTDTNH